MHHIARIACIWATSDTPLRYRLCCSNIAFYVYVKAQLIQSTCKEWTYQVWTPPTSRLHKSRRPTSWCASLNWGSLEPSMPVPVRSVHNSVANLTEYHTNSHAGTNHYGNRLCYIYTFITPIFCKLSSHHRFTRGAMFDLSRPVHIRLYDASEMDSVWTLVHCTSTVTVVIWHHIPVENLMATKWQHSKPCPI